MSKSITIDVSKECAEEIFLMLGECASQDLIRKRLREKGVKLGLRYSVTSIGGGWYGEDDINFLIAERI